MAEAKKPSKKVEKLINDLKDRDERKVIGALKRIPHDGDHLVIFPMLELLATNPSNDVQMLLEKTLFNLKDPNTVKPLMTAVSDKRFENLKVEILTCVWQSGLDASEYTDQLVDLAISDSFEVAIEVMTIVDNLETILDDDLTNNIQKLDKAIENKSDRSTILGNIRQILLDKLLG